MAKKDKKVSTYNSFAPKRRKKKTRQGNGKFSKRKLGRKAYRGQGK